MALIQQISFIQMVLFQLTTGWTTNVTVFQFPPFLTAAEGESVTLNCAVTFKGKLSLIGAAHWTRGKPDGYKLDKSPFYEGRLEESDSDSFTNNRIFIKIFDLTEKDADTYYCRVDLIEFGLGDGNGTKLEVRRRMKESTCLSLKTSSIALWSALTLLVIIILIILACKLKWKWKFNVVSQNEVGNHSDLYSTYMGLELEDVDTYSELHSK